VNVLVICSDTFRFDHLGFLKKQSVQTPQLDRLAAESANFSDFWLCSFPTVVNRIEVFTGRYAFPHYRWGPLPYEFPVLSEVFRLHGYATAVFADNLHLLGEGFGFERGFDAIHHVPGQAHDHFQPPTTPMLELECPVEKIELDERRLKQYRRNAHWYREQRTNTTITLFSKAIEWLREPPEKFFMWIDAFDPHQPWDAPAQYWEPYPWNDNADAVFWPKSGDVKRYPAADVENMRSLYKAEITQIDEWVGKLLDHLRGQGLLDDTAVIFCSDHGYYFGEHGLLGKPSLNQTPDPTAFYEELGHIPLLVRHPRGHAAGKTISGLCQPPDLYTTALDLAGISPVAWAQGNSLVPRLGGTPGSQRFAVGGCYPNRKNLVSCLAVWTDEWCLMYSPLKGIEGSELYHRPSDRTQLHDVISENRKVARELYEQLIVWLDQQDVSRRRKQQLLHNTGFLPWHRQQYYLQLRLQKFCYGLLYGDYVRCPVQS
jgi:arylsulfatase A-like enzyme